MKNKTRWIVGSGVALAILLGCGLSYAAPESARQNVRGGSPTTFSGSATVIDATVLGSRTILEDTGPLAPSGGELEQTFLERSIPGVIDARVLHATTVGQGEASAAEASVVDVNVTALNQFGHTLTASFLRSEAHAVCGSGGATAFGSSEIANLVLNGTPIIVSGEPNQEITLPAGTGRITINEQLQHSTGGRDDADITVNALHVVVLNPVNGETLADVIIASSHADIHCGTTSCKGGDFITGGGWITAPGRNTFGVAGGRKNAGLWGHLTYIDHTTGMKVRGTSVTDYTITGPTSRQIKGTALIDGVPGTYIVDVADNAEPGRNVDTFRLQLSTGYTRFGTLTGGNIQLHKPCN